MNLVYDFNNRFFVIGPAFIEFEREAFDGIPEHLACLFQILPIRQDQQRMMLLTLNPLDTDVLSDVELISGFKPVPVLLDRNGGSPPSWEQIDTQPPTIATRWRPTPYPEGSEVMQSLIDLAYPQPVISSGAAEVDDIPVVRLVDLVLTTAIRDNLEQIWVLPRPKFLVVLAKNQQGWSELMTPTKFIQDQLLVRLKRLAGLDLTSTTPQKSSFKSHQRNFELETHLGENGEEALICLLS
jgi:type IV pilus assembly protein PilB